MKLNQKIVAENNCIHDITATRNDVINQTDIDCFMCNVKGIGSLGVIEIRSKNGSSVFEICPLCNGKSYLAL